MTHSRRARSINVATIFCLAFATATSAAASAPGASISTEDLVTFRGEFGQSAVRAVANPQTVEVEQTEDVSIQIDQDAKLAWLAECRRRANINGVTLVRSDEGTFGAAVAGSRSRKGNRDYCEAYLDDYLHGYTQTNSYAFENRTLPQPAQLAQNASIQLPYEEVIIEEYVPVRSHSLTR